MSLVSAGLVAAPPVTAATPPAPAATPTAPAAAAVLPGLFFNALAVVEPALPTVLVAAPPTGLGLIAPRASLLVAR